MQTGVIPEGGGQVGGGCLCDERAVAVREATELRKAAIIPHPKRHTCRLNGLSPGARPFFRLDQSRCSFPSSANPVCVVLGLCKLHLSRHTGKAETVTIAVAEEARAAVKTAALELTEFCTC